MIKVKKGNKLLYEIMISTRLFSLNNHILSLAEGTLFGRLIEALIRNSKR